MLEAGHSVTVVDNFMYKQQSLSHVLYRKGLNVVIGDVRDHSLMEKLLQKNDILIPLAAIVGAPACDRNPVLASEVNLSSTIWLIEKASQNQLIIMPTTNSAYGGGNGVQICDEKSPLNPLSKYAKDKVVVENSLLQRDNTVSLRLATVFGISPRMRLDLLVNNFVYRALTEGVLVIFQGHFMRNYVHVRDVTSAIRSIVDNPSGFVGEAFNLGLSTANISKMDLAQTIRSQLPNLQIVESSIGDDPDKRNYRVSNKKIESRGFSARFTLEEGISELIRGLPMYFRFPNTNLDT
jgi:nucleoside-diphosphate-sugar epimerase